MQSLLKTSAKAAALTWLALTLSGCGQKGPLYLPTSAASAVSTPSNAASQ